MEDPHKGEVTGKECGNKRKDSRKKLLKKEASWDFHSVWCI